MGTTVPDVEARGALEEFLTAMDAMGDPKLEQHPMKEHPHWKATYIPMARHGDAIPPQSSGPYTALPRETAPTDASPLL